MAALSAGSRFAGFGAGPARLLLALLLTLILYGLASPPAPVPAKTGNARQDVADVRLYDAVVEGVRAGGDYHEVVAAEHRARDYPLRPFVTMRLPTLAWAQAALPGRTGSTILLHLLIALTAAAWGARLQRAGARPSIVAAAALLVLAGSLTLRLPELLSWHEGWAALLIALSLALRRDGRFAGAVALGLAAVLIREHAILYPLAMGALALLAARRGEAAAWMGVVAVFSAFLLWHAGRVAAVTFASDLLSPGWSAGGGWSFALTAAQLTGPLRLFPYQASAILVPLALLGWAGWRDGSGARGALLLGGYLLVFACFGRVDNFYWGFLIAPLVPLGLLFAPRALADLARSAAGRGAAAQLQHG